MNVSADETLCFQVMLPDSAESSAQNLASAAMFMFIAEQYD